MYLCKSPANTLSVRWEVKKPIILKTETGVGERAIPVIHTNELRRLFF